MLRVCRCNDRSLCAVERLGDLEGKRNGTEQVVAARDWRWLIGLFFIPVVTFLLLIAVGIATGTRSIKLSAL